MPRSVLTALRIASLLVVIAGFLALATTDTFDAILILVPLILGAIMPICEQLDAQYPGYRKLTTAINVLVLPLVFAAPLVLGLLNAVVMLVIYIQIYLVLHKKRERDYYYLYLMAFFLLVASCVLSPDAAISLVMLTFLVSSVWAFLILQIYVESERNQNAATPDLLALHEQDHQVIAPAERWLDAGVILPVSGLCALSILLTTALFIFTPRMEAGFLGRRDPARFVTGLSSEVSVPTSGEIQPDPRLVLRVEFPDEPNGRYGGELFWRVCAYDTYNGTRWTRRHIATHFRDDVPSANYRIPIEEDTDTHVLVRDASRNSRIVHHVVYLDEIPDEGLPCLSTVTRLEFTPPTKSMRIAWSGDNDGAILLRSSRQTSVAYEAWSEVEDDVPPEALRNANDTYRDAIGDRDYEQLTDYDLSPATEDLARELTADADNTYDKVRALEAWFRSPAFEYSFIIPYLNPDRPIDDFVLNVRIGHCQLYATAMALMLRSLGIPCRVVSGFRGADWIDAEEAYVVRADMAHLWVEVYFLDYGWFSFDPSPPVDRELTGLGRWARQASLWTLRAKMFWLSQVVGFNGFQMADIRALGAGLFNFGSDDSEPASESESGTIRVPVLAVFMLFSSIGLVFFLRSGWRNRGIARVRLTLDQMRAQRLFHAMRLRLRQVGLMADGLTAEELAEECAVYPPEPRQSLMDAIQIYNAARFGGRALPSDQLARLKKGLRVLKNQVRGG